MTSSKEQKIYAIELYYPSF